MRSLQLSQTPSLNFHGWSGMEWSRRKGKGARGEKGVGWAGAGRGEDGNKRRVERKRSEVAVPPS